jgi:hypothetical protein
MDWIQIPQITRNQGRHFVNTIADRILDSLARTPYQTNAELARHIVAPEPSVRRAALRLESAGRIEPVNDTGRQLVWALREPNTSGYGGITPN